MSALRTRPLSAVAAAPVRWLWEPYLARGKLALLDGDPGAGKSAVALDLAARLARGGPLPDGQTLDRPHTTLLLAAEDDAADTLRPRADAAGADAGRLVVATAGRSEATRFPDDLWALRDAIERHSADLVVIDPLAYFVPPAAGGRLFAVLRALVPLADVAARTGCAVLLVRHLTKDARGKSVYRGLGSAGIIGAVRAGMIVTPHPDDPGLRVLAMTKTNLGPPAPSLGFRVVADAAGRATVEWVGPVDVTADELCRVVAANPGPRERAAEWLRAELANGPRLAAEVIAAAAAMGFPERTIDRAKKDAKVLAGQVFRDGRNVWVWSGADP